MITDATQDYQKNEKFEEILVPEEGPMTLCMAAECTHKGKRAIVLCRDWLAQKGSVTSDDADKQRDIDDYGLSCRVLIAGSPTRADHLLMACDPAIREFMRKNGQTETDVDTDKLLQGLRAATKLVRRDLVNNWVASTLNMEFDDFLQHGRKDLHESHYHDVWETIRRYDLGAELLITLFDATGDSVIIRTDGLGEVYWESDYSVIGSGGEIARAFLCQVDYDPDKMSIADCIYEVLKAKYSAEISREVGRGTTVLVTARGGTDLYLSKKGHDYYEDLLIPYRTPELKFEDDFLELDDEPEVSSDGEQKQAAEESGVSSPESPGGSGAGGSTGGDSAPTDSVPRDGSQQS
jgi:hypothetical protein